MLCGLLTTQIHFPVVEACFRFKMEDKRRRYVDCLNAKWLDLSPRVLLTQQHNQRFQLYFETTNQVGSSPRSNNLPQLTSFPVVAMFKVVPQTSILRGESRRNLGTPNIGRDRQG